MQAAFLFKLSNNQQNQSQNQEDGANPLGSTCDLGVHALGLVLSQEGIGNATDSTGQTSVLAGLEQNGQANHQTAEELKNSNNDDCDFHVD